MLRDNLPLSEKLSEAFQEAKKNKYEIMNGALGLFLAWAMAGVFDRERAEYVHKTKVNMAVSNLVCDPPKNRGSVICGAKDISKTDEYMPRILLGGYVPAERVIVKVETNTNLDLQVSKEGSVQVVGETPCTEILYKTASLDAETINDNVEGSDWQQFSRTCAEATLFLGK